MRRFRDGRRWRVVLLRRDRRRAGSVFGRGCRRRERREGQVRPLVHCRRRRQLQIRWWCGGHGLRRSEPIDLVSHGRRRRRSGRRRAGRRRGRRGDIRERGVEPIEIRVERNRRCFRRRRHAGRGRGNRGRRPLFLRRRRGRRRPPCQELLHATDHELRLERFCQHAIAAGFRRARLVHRFERAGQQHHRNVRQPRRLLDESRDLVAVAPGHPDVGEHDVRRRRLEALNRLLAIADRGHLDVLVGERQLDDALNRHAVVGQKEGVWHLGPIG